MNDQKKNATFDEETLGKLLEAAHVLQEHSRSLAPGTTEHIEPLAPAQEEAPKAPWEESTPDAPSVAADNNVSEGDFTLTLAHIVEAQHQIKTRKLSLEDAAALVAKRAACIANASGAAVNLLEDDGVRTLAACGRSALSVGSKINLPQALSQACLRTGQIIRCSDINQEFLVDADEARRRGIMALIAVPIFRDGDVAGSLEVYFAGAQTFIEQNIHSCQVTAGLITEVLARDQRQAAGLAPAEDPCPKCGHNFQPLELFCGKCGAARAKAPANLADPLEALWNTGHQTKLDPGATDSISTSADAHPSDAAVGAIASDGSETADANFDPAALDQDETVTADATAEPPAGALAKTGADAWASAADARNFLESVAAARGSGGLGAFWRSHRGDLCLAAAVVLVAVAVRWGIWSSPVGASSRPLAPGHRRRVDPEAGLSVSDKLMISLGLADPPDPPEDKGNPSAQVWVDEKTGLYYCPGADSYGKTAKGKYETQRDAQLDEYEPADRRACD